MKSGAWGKLDKQQQEVHDLAFANYPRYVQFMEMIATVVTRSTVRLHATCRKRLPRPR
jgi:hypothetical protein